MLDPLEQLWDNLLSRQPEVIHNAYVELNLEEQQSVIAHLRKMNEEPGWQDEQRISARAALQVLQISSAGTDEHA